MGVGSRVSLALAEHGCCYFVCTCSVAGNWSEPWASWRPPRKWSRPVYF